MPALVLLAICLAIVGGSAWYMRRRDSAVDDFPLAQRAHLDAERQRWGKGDAAGSGGG